MASTNGTVNVPASAPTALEDTMPASILSQSAPLAAVPTDRSYVDETALCATLVIALESPHMDALSGFDVLVTSGDKGWQTVHAGVYTFEIRGFRAPKSDAEQIRLHSEALQEIRVRAATYNKGVEAGRDALAAERRAFRALRKDRKSVV